MHGKSDDRPSNEIGAQNESDERNTVNVDERKSKAHEGDISCAGYVEVDGKMILQLYKNSIEILARIGILEENMMKNPMMKMQNVRSNESKAEIERFHLFMKSNGFPMTSLQQVDALEVKLKDSSFNEAAVSILVYFSS